MSLTNKSTRSVQTRAHRDVAVHKSTTYSNAETHEQQKHQNIAGVKSSSSEWSNLTCMRAAVQLLWLSSTLDSDAFYVALGSRILTGWDLLVLYTAAKRPVSSYQHFCLTHAAM